MRPEDFEHVVAAAAEATGSDEFVVIGSQAILGSYSQSELGSSIRPCSVGVRRTYRLQRPRASTSSGGCGPSVRRRDTPPTLGNKLGNKYRPDLAALHSEASQDAPSMNARPSTACSR